MPKANGHHIKFVISLLNDLSDFRKINIACCRLLHPVGATNIGYLCDCSYFDSLIPQI